MIQATRKTGLLVEDGAKLGSAVVYLRSFSSVIGDKHAREIADYLDGIRALTYYEPVPSVDQVEEARS